MHDRTAGCADGAKAEVDATKVVMMREVVNFMVYYLLWLCWVGLGFVLLLLFGNLHRSSCPCVRQSRGRFRYSFDIIGRYS